MQQLEIISKRYERGSIIITTNKVFEEWLRIFYDPVLATAILDRFVHHCHFVVIKGESYRMKQREGAIKTLTDDSKNESNQLNNDN
ncbi:IstB-like ATP binding protein [Caldicellulosiruptor bescii]|nr:IstB-like ATP binding protein [Caldicellulosiruptor bescii]SMR90692.1 IstB-like ATP binding protein [Caldicellulosiruptor bescii]